LVTLAGAFSDGGTDQVCRHETDTLDYHRISPLLVLFGVVLARQAEATEGLVSRHASGLPPLLPDYLDDAVSADTLAPLVTKMIVIQALEVTPLG
jgi:hypothetical protein